MTSNDLNWTKDDYTNITNPFEGDHWERKQFAEHLTGYVGRLKVGATIALDAEWGAGKTWFVQHWKQHLINEGFKVAYLDAFANDYIEDPFLVIATEIGNQIEKQDKSLGQSVKNKAIAVWHAMLPSLPKLLFSATMTLMGAGLFAPIVTEALKAAKDGSGDLGEAMAEDFGDRIKEQLEEKVKNYEADKQTVEGFKKQLSDVASQLDKPLVFIIDELDRCKPEFSIRLIERIKHFFDTPNIVFVLSMHKVQLCESIDSYYGFKEKNNYLEKFIDVTFQIRLKNGTDSNKYESFLKFQMENLGVLFRENIFNLAKLLCEHSKPTPRELKSILNKFSLLAIDQDHRAEILLITLFLINKDDNTDQISVFFNKIRVMAERNYKTKMGMGPNSALTPTQKNQAYSSFVGEANILSKNLEIIMSYSAKNLPSSSETAELIKYKDLFKPSNSLYFNEANPISSWIHYVQKGI